jgi:EAL domain-containing protein (putative c-di-GMP-specific phosphodiesterase class I)
VINTRNPERRRRTGDLNPAEASLLADLGQAAARGEFSLVYQQQVDHNDQLTGVESLLRWDHPERGLVGPAYFIPLAEQAGVIRPVTRWVLDRVLSETKDLGDLPVGFNASALEFADPAFAGEVEALVDKHGFDPTRLEIEVTETAILADGEEVHRTMAALHGIGVKIALDDFGAGYSSLNHLRLYPFDKLKIDQAFVAECSADAQSAALINGVVYIGRALGMKVVAEGVETRQQQAFLRDAGVHAMQGYLFGKPAPVADLKAALAG